MNLKRLLFITFFFLFFCFIQIHAGLAEDLYIELSLKECIERVLVENLSFKSSYLGLRTDELSIIQAESRFDPALSLNMNRSHSETPTYFEYFDVKSIESKNTQLDFTLNQNISTGANWGIGFYNSLSESNIETEKNYTSNFGININQPLLKGFGKKINRSNIFLARLSKETTLYDLEDGATTLVFNVQRAYWNLVYARESLEVMEMSVAQADSLLNYNRKGLELGILTESDVLEAESMFLSRKQDVLDQKSRIQADEDALRRLLNLTSGEDWRKRIVPADEPSVTDIETDTGTALAKAVQLRPDFKIALKQLEQYELNRTLAKNNMKPSLNLNARYNIHGSGKTYSKDLRDMGDFQQYGWQVGLLFSYPLKNRNAKAEHEKRIVDIKRANLSIEDLENRILTEIRTGARNVEIFRERIDVTKLAVEVDELKLRKEEERFRNQLSTSYFVLQFQTDLANSRNQYNKALMDYTMAVVELQRARGTLLKDLNVSIITVEN